MGDTRDMETFKENAKKVLEFIKKHIIPIVIVIAVIIAGGIFVYINNKDTLTFDNGETISLYAGTSADLKLNSKKNRTYTSADIVYESTDASVAEVTTEGKLNGLKEGTATVTCTLAKGRCEPASINVEVKKDVLTINEGTQLSLKAGKSANITISAESGTN